jgi:AraC-like DNA-binding protein
MLSTIDIFWILILCINSLGFFILSIFLYKKKECRKTNSLVMMTFLFCVLFMLNNYLFESRIVLKYPHLYEILTPAEYFIPATLYLYIRANFHKYVLKKFDWLFFLPAIFLVIDFLPFYMLDKEEKRMIIEQALNQTNILPRHDVGFFPAYFHIVFTFIYGFVLNVDLWVKFKQYVKLKGNAKLTEIDKSTQLFLTVFSLAPLALVLVYFLKDTSITYTYIFTSLLTIPILGLILYLMLNPKLLYGKSIEWTNPETYPFEVNLSDFNAHASIEEDKSEVVPEEESEQKKFELGKELLVAYKEQIETFLEQEKPFLKPGYALGDLSSDLNIPKHHLSITFNVEFNTRYNDLLNRYRIEYAQALILDKSMEHLTLEAIAMESGFNSRVTFIRAFTKLTGMTPSDFNKDISV